MSEREPNLVPSGLSRRYDRNGIAVEICIYRIEDEPGWALEVVNQTGRSIVWDDVFDTDDAANDAFLRTVDEEGIEAFLDNAKVIQCLRRPD